MCPSPDTDTNALTPAWPRPRPGHLLRLVGIRRNRRVDFAAAAAARRAAWSAWQMPNCSSTQTGTLRDSDLETWEDVLVPRAALLLGTPLETE